MVSANRVLRVSCWNVTKPVLTTWNTAPQSKITSGWWKGFLKNQVYPGGGSKVQAREGRRPRMQKRVREERCSAVLLRTLTNCISLCWLQMTEQVNRGLMYLSIIVWNHLGFAPSALNSHFSTSIFSRRWKFAYFPLSFPVSFQATKTKSPFD